jgi:hypothetical protein
MTQAAAAVSCLRCRAPAAMGDGVQACVNGVQGNIRRCRCDRLREPRLGSRSVSAKVGVEAARHFGPGSGHRLGSPGEWSVVSGE